MRNLTWHSTTNTTMEHSKYRSIHHLFREAFKKKKPITAHQIQQQMHSEWYKASQFYFVCIGVLEKFNYAKTSWSLKGEKIIICRQRLTVRGLNRLFFSKTRDPNAKSRQQLSISTTERVCTNKKVKNTARRYESMANVHTKPNEHRNTLGQNGLFVT